MPAYMTALGTSSSAATIPVTVECTKRNAIPDAIADFVIPLCATIHLAGSTLKITTFAVAIMIVTGMDLNVPALLAVVFQLAHCVDAAEFPQQGDMRRGEDFVAYTFPERLGLPPARV